MNSILIVLERSSMSAVTDLTAAVQALDAEVHAVVDKLNAAANDPAVTQAVADINNAVSSLQAAVAALP